MSWSRLDRFATLCLFAIAFLSGSTLVADPIEPWQGGRAEASAFRSQQSQQGSPAEAYAQGVGRLYYSTDNFPGEELSVETRSNARAQVLGTADSLLRVQASYQVDNPGSRPYSFYPSDPWTPDRAMAQASWSGDRIHLQPGANGTLPDSIRVGVTVTLSNPAAWTYDPRYPQSGEIPRSGTVDVQVGDRHLQIAGSSTNSDLTGWLESLGFDSAKGIPIPGHPGAIGSYEAKAFLDLALDAQGWSDPFDLSLKSAVAGFPESNQRLLMFPGEFTLGLDDITLSDGTSVTAAGYNVTFDSGLAWPVPEPASVACWTALAIAAGWFSRRRAKINFAGV